MLLAVRQYRRTRLVLLALPVGCQRLYCFHPDARRKLHEFYSSKRARSLDIVRCGYSFMSASVCPRKRLSPTTTGPDVNGVERASGRGGAGEIT